MIDIAKLRSMIQEIILDIDPKQRENIDVAATSLICLQVLKNIQYMESKCVVCSTSISKEMTNKCPKHLAIHLATESAKNKVREHGPMLAMLMATKAQDMLSQWLGPNEKENEAELNENKEDHKS